MEPVCSCTASDELASARRQLEELTAAHTATKRIEEGLREQLQGALSAAQTNHQRLSQCAHDYAEAKEEAARLRSELKSERRGKEEAESLVRTLQEKITSLEAENAASRRRASLEKPSSDATQNPEPATQEGSAANRQLLLSRIDAALAEAQRLREQLCASREVEAAARNELHETRQRLEKLIGENAAAQQRCIDIQAEREVAQLMLQSELKELKEHAAKVALWLTSLHGHATSLLSGNEEIKQLLQTLPVHTGTQRTPKSSTSLDEHLQNELEVKSELNIKLLVDCEMLRKELDTAREDLTAASHRTESQEAELARLRDETQALLKRFEAKVAEQAGANIVISSLKAQSIELERGFSQAQARVLQLLREKEALQAQVSDLTGMPLPLELPDAVQSDHTSTPQRSPGSRATPGSSPGIHAREIQQLTEQLAHVGAEKRELERRLVHMAEDAGHLRGQMRELQGEFHKLLNKLTGQSDAFAGALRINEELRKHTELQAQELSELRQRCAAPEEGRRPSLDQPERPRKSKEASQKEKAKLRQLVKDLQHTVTFLYHTRQNIVITIRDSFKSLEQIILKVQRAKREELHALLTELMGELRACIELYLTEEERNGTGSPAEIAAAAAAALGVSIPPTMTPPPLAPATRERANSNGTTHAPRQQAASPVPSAIVLSAPEPPEPLPPTEENPPSSTDGSPSSQDEQRQTSPEPVVLLEEPTRSKLIDIAEAARRMPNPQIY